MSRKLLTVIGYIFLLLPLQLCFAKNIPENTTTQLRQIVLKIKKRFHINAISLAVLMPRQIQPIVINEGTTQIGNHIPLSKNNLFQIGSLTKTFTATLAAQVIINKKLSLNDKVGFFFPQYKKWKKITIAQLINQNSGIPDYDQYPGFFTNLTKHPHKVWDPKTLIKLSYQLPENFKPGDSWAYSNTNYVLLGMILSKVEGKSTKTLMSGIIRQANLNHTYFMPMVYPKSIMKNMVHGYYDTSDNTQVNGSWLQTAGAMVSNPFDLVRWFHELLNNNSIKGLPIMQWTAFKSTSTGSLVNKITQSAYSFGLFRLNTPEGLLYFTPGLTPGYTAMMVYVPCLGVYFAYSAARAPLRGFHQDMMMGVMKVLKHRFKQGGFIAPSYCKKIKPAKRFTFPKIG